MPRHPGPLTAHQWGQADHIARAPLRISLTVQVALFLVFQWAASGMARSPPASRRDCGRPMRERCALTASRRRELPARRGPLCAMWTAGRKGLASSTQWRRGLGLRRRRSAMAHRLCRHGHARQAARPTSRQSRADSTAPPAGMAERRRVPSVLARRQAVPDASGGDTQRRLTRGFINRNTFLASGPIGWCGSDLHQGCRPISFRHRPTRRDRRSAPETLRAGRRRAQPPPSLAGRAPRRARRPGAAVSEASQTAGSRGGCARRTRPAAPR